MVRVAWRISLPTIPCEDNGNHEDCSYIELTNKNGKNALQVIAVGDTPLSFSALPYSVADLYAARHDFELKQSGNPNLRYTYFSLDCAVLGLGNSSCGPGVLKKYAIDKTRSYSYIQDENTMRHQVFGDAVLR